VGKNYEAWDVGGEREGRFKLDCITLVVFGFWMMDDVKKICS
jgi:hypothetical protein